MRILYGMCTLAPMALFMLSTIEIDEAEARPTYVFFVTEDTDCPGGAEGWCAENPWFTDCGDVSGLPSGGGSTGCMVG